MTAKSVLVRPQGLRLGARAPTCPPLLRHCMNAKLVLLKNCKSMLRKLFETK